MMTAQPQADDRATEFKAVEGGPEQFSGNTLVVEAYAAIWLVLMGWLLLMWRKQSVLNGRIEGLEAALDRAEAKRSQGTLVQS